MMMVRISEETGEELCAFNLRSLPVELRFAFRAMCADYRIGMSDALIRLMAEAVDTHKIPGVPLPETPGIELPRFTKT